METSWKLAYFPSRDSNAPSEYGVGWKTGASGETVFGTLLFSANINKAAVLFTSKGLPRNTRNKQRTRSIERVQLKYLANMTFPSVPLSREGER